MTQWWKDFFSDSLFLRSAYCVWFISKMVFIHCFFPEWKPKGWFWTMYGEAFSFCGAWEATEGKIQGTWPGAPSIASTSTVLPYLFYPVAVYLWFWGFCLFFWFFSFFLPTSMEYGSSWTRDQNPYWSPDPRCTSDDTGSLTLWATQDELQDDGFRNFHCLKNIWKPSLWGTGVILHTKKKLLLLKNSFRLFTSPRREIRDFFPLSQSQVLPWLECLEFFFLTKEVSAL